MIKTLLYGCAFGLILFSCKSSVQLPAPDMTKAESNVATKITALMQEVESDPGSADKWGLLAMNLDIHDFKAEGIHCYKKAAALDPAAFRWPYYLGLALAATGDESAHDALKQAQKINPGYAPLNYRLGMSNLALGNNKEAQDNFQQAAQSSNPNIKAFSLWGESQVFLAEDKVKSAIKLLEQAKKLQPYIREVHAQLATLYRQNGQLELAEAETIQLDMLPERLPIEDNYTALLEQQGESSYWHSIRGRRFLDAGNYDAALDAFQTERAIKKSADVYNSLGMTYQYREQHRQAAALFRQAIEMAPDYAEAFNNLGISLFSMNRLQAAIDTLNQALKLKPTYSDPYLNLGTFQVINGKTGEARKVFKTGLEKADYDIRIGARLAWLMSTATQSKHRDGRTAMALAEKVCRKTGYQTVSYIDIYAAACAEARHFKKAVALAQQALELGKRGADPGTLRQIQNRLDLFKKKKPFRDRSLL